MHTAHTDYWRSLCLILLLMVSVTTYAAADSIHTSSVLQDGPLAGQPLGKIKEKIEEKYSHIQNRGGRESMQLKYTQRKV